MEQPKLRPAIIYDDGRVYVEFTFEKFSELFSVYLNDISLVDALKKIEKDLREETKRV